MTEERSRAGRALALVFGVALVVAVVGLVYFAVAPVPATPPDTEFYVLNASGVAGEYPETLAVGETATVVVGVENHEHETVTYRMVVEHDRGTLARQSVTLADGERWRQEVSLSFDSPGDTRVDILLYRGERTDSYRELYLRLTVQE